MNKTFLVYRNRISLSLLISLLSALVIFLTLNKPTVEDYENILAQKKSLKVKTKKARSDYFFKMLRDPATNSIPRNIRLKELEFAKKIPKHNKGLFKTNALTFEWKEAGPNDVGGRTRALAVDRMNSNIIIAGGASGGIWKSEDAGVTWDLKSEPSQQLNVTYVVQDPGNGRENIWYYTSGEFDNTIGDNINRSVTLVGSGIFKSTDNGDTWNLIQSAGNPVAIDTPYDFVSKIVISPTTGSIFISSNLFGVLRSTDEGSSFQLSLGDQPNDHNYVEVDVAADGTLLATLSDGQNFNSQNSPGIYISMNDGVDWTDITPDGYDTPSRAVVAFAPSNNEIAYVWADFEGINGFYKINGDDGTIEDRSNNLPDCGGPVGNLDTQGSYNMILEVKPDDENFVILGGTNLFRSTDGFATPANSAIENWIGGYDIDNDISLYNGQHPDQHSLFFDPDNPDKLWSGHDGGLSFIEDINTSGQRLSWVNKNNGYNVTQFYHLSIARGADDTRIVGGTQDNGSPYFTFDGNTTSASGDVSSGDGAFSYIGTNFLYSSSQSAGIIRLALDQNGTPRGDQWASVRPVGLQNALFIHPYIVDPNNEDIMYTPDGNKLWRNNSLSTITNQDQNGTDEGWTDLGVVLSDPNSDYFISALTVSNTPANILYMGLTNLFGESKVIKLENSNTATSGFEDVSIPNPPNGAYLTNIAVNPTDANEIVVVFGNYNVISIYYSADGGQNYSEVDGNLEGEISNPGPSIRAATILPFNNEKAYLIATSTGVYSTQTLNGSSTVWIQEGSDVIGNVVCAHLTSRVSDGMVAVASHGRGIFTGSAQEVTGINSEEQIPSSFILEQNYPNPFNPETAISYRLAISSYVTIKVYDAIGNEVTTLVNGIKQPGNHKVNFSANGLASGVYYYSLSAGGLNQTKKMVMLK